VPFANKNCAVRNDRDVTGSGADEDYRIHVLNEARGCIAWNTVVPGNRFVPFLTPEGIVAADLRQEILLSESIYRHPASDAGGGVGDFAFEAPLCVAATAADTDGAYASARIMRGTLWVNFRASGSTPNRQVAYDFSTGHASNGLEGLVRDDGRTRWGWSVPLVRSLTAMCEGRRSDGAHMYGWNDDNGGSTGDGRLDEFETSETDNGTAIAGSIETPLERLGLKAILSAQEVTVEHASPAGSTGKLDLHRGLSDVVYSMTPSTGSTTFVRDLKMLTQEARGGIEACYLGYRQLTGSAREVRSLELRAKSLPSYK
jgi:hypothetical protein